MTAGDPLREALSLLAAGRDLSRELAAESMGRIMEGEVTPAGIGAFLMGLRVKGETTDEITGCAEAIRARVLPVPHRHERLVDTCGTGGDGASTFNISTAAAFVVAGAGQTVAKHGNRAISSRTGSADVLEHLGVRIEMAGPEAAAALDEVGIAFLFAPRFHAAMRHAAPVRRELGLRTVFNVLGPLCNPAGARTQVVGVYDGARVATLARVLGNLGADRAMVVHGSDGLDELTTTGPSRVAEWDGERVREYVVDPAELGLPRAAAADLAGGDAAVNAGLLRRVLEGEPGPRRDITLLNAAAALVVAGAAEDLRDALETAARSVDSGAALARLEALIAYSARETGTDDPGRGADRIEAGTPGWGR